MHRYADNFALSFFHSQGFTHRISLPVEVYTGVIGEYEDSVLMECVLHPELPYGRMPGLVRLAREAALRDLAVASTDHTRAADHSRRRRKKPKRRSMRRGSGDGSNEDGDGGDDGKGDGGGGGTGSRRRGGGSRRGMLVGIAKRGDVRLGRWLADALRRSGRQLAKPEWLSTDFGCGLGTRLVPVAHGVDALMRGGSAVGAALGPALTQTISLPELHLTHRRALCSADERRLCKYYQDTPQLLADLHRYDLAPFALASGPLRSALALADQARPQPADAT